MTTEIAGIEDGSTSSHWLGRVLEGNFSVLWLWTASPDSPRQNIRICFPGKDYVHLIRVLAALIANLLATCTGDLDANPLKRRYLARLIH